MSHLQLKLKESMWALHSCGKTLSLAGMAGNHVFKLEMRARSSQPGTYDVGFKEESDFAFGKGGALILLILRQDDKPFNIVPGSSVYSNLSQIAPQWASQIFPFSNGNSGGWICSEFIITLSALTKKPHTKAAGVWSGSLGLFRKGGREGMSTMKRSTSLKMGRD